MNTILYVLSNLKHNGDVYAAGSFIEATEADLKALETLVTDGVLRVMEGAKTTAEAAETIANEKAVALDAVESAKENAPEDTWGPKTETTAEKVDTTATETKVDTGSAPIVGTGDVDPNAGKPAAPSGNDL